jgi:hypothetical protein
MSVQIQYTPAGGPLTTLTFKRGPVNFKPYFDGRVHDNLGWKGRWKRLSKARPNSPRLVR